MKKNILRLVAMISVLSVVVLGFTGCKDNKKSAESSKQTESKQQ